MVDRILSLTLTNKLGLGAVEDFIYLGFIVASNGSGENDIRKRIAMGKNLISVVQMDRVYREDREAAHHLPRLFHFTMQRLGSSRKQTANESTRFRRGGGKCLAFIG